MGALLCCVEEPKPGSLELKSDVSDVKDIALQEKSPEGIVRVLVAVLPDKVAGVCSQH